ncbi:MULTISPECIES: hypothetical protein [unclassified Streptomyces]|uniref:hypothetical protein n=1 Tax=unclassified Streptomyces TaxID=2593676 RepID=UPI00336A98EB
MADNLVLTDLKHHAEKTGKIMPHHTTLRHARKAAAAMLIAVAAFGLTACQDSGTDASSSPSTSASAPKSPAPTAKTTQDPATSTPSGTPKKPGTKCTDQINYAGDPRPNADINTIGEETGYCPPVQHQ